MLLMALESEDMKQITQSVVSILWVCISSGGVKDQALASFVIQYLFFNVRSWSVGESA